MMLMSSLLSSSLPPSNPIKKYPRTLDEYKQWFAHDPKFADPSYHQILEHAYRVLKRYYDILFVYTQN